MPCETVSMALPSNNTAWPPITQRGLINDYRQWAAWYSGDMADLSNVYGTVAEQSLTRRADMLRTWAASRFWGRRGETTLSSRMRLHVPVASDIATTSADLLFGEDPTITIDEAHALSAPADAIAAQDRIAEIANELGLTNLLHSGAETCAALGGVYLVPGWNVDLADYPLLNIVDGDAALPEWQGNQLAAVTFWKVLPTLEQDGPVYRMLERHENGQIFTGLYVGAADNLGTQVPLNRHPETANSADVITIPQTILMGRPIMVRYVPNVRPHRRYRSLPIGRSDYAGAEGVMDALDEAYSSWMRDIRLGQSRLIVSEGSLDRYGRGHGATFDLDREVFTEIAIDPNEKSAPITPVQFNIRTTEHAETCAHLFERIVTGAGYSPQTFGLNISGQAESGTALRVREGKTIKTRGRKARFWVPAIASVLETMLAIDREILGHTEHGVYRPTVIESSIIVSNPIEVAQSVSLLRGAQAISVDTSVRMAQPDLDEPAIKAEVARILAEQANAADPTGGLL